MKKLVLVTLLLGVLSLNVSAGDIDGTPRCTQNCPQTAITQKPSVLSAVFLLLLRLTH